MYADDIVIFLNKNYSSFQKVLNKLIKNFKNVGLSVNHTNVLLIIINLIMIYILIQLKLIN